MVKAKRNIEIIKHLNRFFPLLLFLKDPKPNVQGFSTSTSWLYIISHTPPPPYCISSNSRDMAKQSHGKSRKNSLRDRACFYRCLAGIELCEALRGAGMGVNISTSRYI